MPILPYCLTALLPYCLTALLPYCLTALLPYCPTALLPYCPTALLPYCPECWVFAPLELRRTLRYLDDAVVAVDPHPVAVLDDAERVLVEVGHRRGAGDNSAQRHLGGHDVEHHALGGHAGNARHVEVVRPAG